VYFVGSYCIVILKRRLQ